MHYQPFNVTASHFTVFFVFNWSVRLGKIEWLKLFVKGNKGAFITASDLISHAECYDFKKTQIY